MDSSTLYQFDLSFIKRKKDYIVGIDEVGRGPLAGPVIASAVILNLYSPIIGINDSKKLTSSKRIRLFKEISNKALSIGIGVVDHNTIDKINILNATKKAMNIAFNNLNIKPSLCLIDGITLTNLDYPVYKIIKGDTLSASIASASIIAKVIRDRLMESFHNKYPNYLFNKHKGYPTKKHIELLKKLGPSPIHRKSYYPVKQAFIKK